MKLNINEFHLWFVEDKLITTPSLLQYYKSLLNSEEQEQHGRFYFEKDRHQFLITRSHLRLLLSLYVPEIQPGDWRFHKNNSGKPYIANDINMPLYFNLSHTDGMIVVVVAAQDNIGIDVEYLKRKNDISELAKSVFATSESDYFNNLPPNEQQRYFFLLWTLKEAYVKARGVGISLPMEDLVYHANQHAIELKNNEPTWNFWSIEPSENYQVSLAANQSPSEIHFKMHKINSFDHLEPIDYTVNPIPLLCVSGMT